MGWKFHVLKLAIFGRVPFGNSIRRVKRRMFGYPPDVENLRGTLSNFNDMKCAVESTGRSFSGATVLEIGSGWFPTIPIMLSLHGAHKVYLSDLTPHMDHVTFSATLDFLRPQLMHSKYSQEMAIRSNIHDFGFEYLAPFQMDEVPDGSVDFVVSRTVLEHIPVTELPNLLFRLRPKLSLNGIMVHYIDHSDHLEHKDKSITKINFLSWSERRHSFVNWLTKEGENRLRHHEYRELFERSGYEVVGESGQPHKPTFDVAKKLSLNGRFAKMTPEQVSILSSIYLLSPKSIPGATQSE